MLDRRDLGDDGLVNEELAAGRPTHANLELGGCGALGGFQPRRRSDPVAIAASERHELLLQRVVVRVHPLQLDPGALAHGGHVLRSQPNRDSIGRAAGDGAEGLLDLARISMGLAGNDGRGALASAGFSDGHFGPDLVALRPNFPAIEVIETGVCHQVLGGRG